MDELDKFTPHRKHLCHNCGNYFKSEFRGVSNPLLPFLEEQVDKQMDNSFGGLQVFTINDVIQCAEKLDCALT